MKLPITPRKALVLTCGILFLAGVGAVAAHLLLSNSPKPAAPVKRQLGEVIILCAGDSITADSYPERLENRLRESGLNARVLNYGAPGFTSREYLRYMNSEALLEKTQPDIVLLQLGTNDVRADFNCTSTETFISNMKEIIRLIGSHRTWSKPPVLLLAQIPPVVKSFPEFSAKSVARVAKEINPAIQRIAEENHLVLVDNYTTFAEHPELMDGIHPTQEGYQIMADNWFDALMKNHILEKRPTNSLSENP